MADESRNAGAPGVTLDTLSDIMFETGVLVALRRAAEALIARGLDDAATIVLNTPRPTRSEVGHDA